jgi:predicted lipid-binding transport protein (Tim44 family)
MALALPPLQPNARVLDFLGGSGAAAEAVAGMYETRLHVMDSSAERLKRASARFDRARLPQPTLLHHSATMAEPVPAAVRGEGFHLITAALALHHLLEHTQQSAAEKLSSLRGWLGALHGSLVPGGHLFIVDHTGQQSVCTQLQQLLAVGFVDVEVAWRVDDMFVIGARRALDNATPLSANSPDATAASSQAPAAPSPSAASRPAPSSAASSAATAPVASVTTAAPAPASATAASAGPSLDSAITSSSFATAAVPVPSHSLHPSMSDDEEINKMIAALQAQNEDLKARLAAAPQQPAQAAVNPSAAEASGAAALPAAASSGFTSEYLTSKLPQLFARFDPRHTGQMTFAALQALCRAVGRPCDDGSGGDDGGEDDSLWWTYQSVAQADPDSGTVGLSIEDLNIHFYKTKLFDLEHDLRKLNLL